MIFRIQ